LNLDEITHWKPFQPPEGDEIDLSYLDAHQVTYTHSAPGKADIIYNFWVTYSFHCFAKDYPEKCPVEQASLMYHAPKESRPFCYRRYELSKLHLRNIIENLGSPKTRVSHAQRASYAAVELIDESGDTIWYYVPFRVYKEKKKFRIHVTSAYPLDERPGGGKVGFFKIANNLRKGKKLPEPQK
jgi:hypothetical protein